MNVNVKLKPWHYINYEGNVGLVPQHVADEALAQTKRGCPGDVQMSSCELPIQASQHLIAQIHAGKAPLVKRELGIRLAEFSREIAKRGSVLLCVRVDFVPEVHFRYWYKRSESLGGNTPETVE